MSALLETLATGPLGVNTYILGDTEAGVCAVIDPGGDAERILATISWAELQLAHILNTHAHVDHVGAVAEIRTATRAVYGLHEADLPLLAQYAQQALMMGIRPGATPEVDAFLKDGQVIRLGTMDLTVLHTPGHSPGHICIAAQQVDLGNGVRDIAFVGDLIFRGSVGRTDLLGGDMAQLVESIRTKVFPLGDETVLYPGHGPATTVAHERRYNPFVGQVGAVVHP